MWKWWMSSHVVQTKRCQRGTSHAKRHYPCTFDPQPSTTGSQPLISSLVTLITRWIMALVPFGINQEKREQFCGGSNWNHMLLQPYIRVRAPTGPGRQIHDSARLSQSVTSSRQTGAISGEKSWEPSTNRCDEVSYHYGCLPESRASLPLIDSLEIQANLICTASVCASVSHITACRYRPIQILFNVRSRRPRAFQMDTSSESRCLPTKVWAIVYTHAHRGLEEQNMLEQHISNGCWKHQWKFVVFMSKRSKILNYSFLDQLHVSNWEVWIL